MSMILRGKTEVSMPAEGLSFAARGPNWLGDAVLALPAVRALAASSRRSRLLVLASSTSEEVFRRVPGTLTVRIATAGGGAWSSLGTTMAGARILRSLKPVVVLSFTRSFTSAALCALGGVPRRIGFDGSSGALLYSDRVPWRAEGEHLVETYCRLAESIGTRIADKVPVLNAAPGDLAGAQAVLERHGTRARQYVCLFPGARYGPSKRWPPDRFALLGDAITAKFGLKVVLLGTGSDAEACDRVKGAMARPGLNLCGASDFSALTGMLSLSGAVVANDSGGMHLAASLGVPVVGLFFSTDPGWTGPVSPRARVVRSAMECSPCFRRDCECDAACTRSLTVDQVLEALTQLLREQD